MLLLSLILLLSVVGISSASHATAPHQSSVSASRNYKQHNDTSSTNKNFIHLPGQRSVQDIINANNKRTNNNPESRVQKNELMRGGAVKEQQHDPIMEADYIADTKLPTDMGNFRMRAYRVQNNDEDSSSSSSCGSYSNTNSMEPIIIYAADKPPFGQDGQLLEEVPVRIHDQCLTSEVFRSRRCDCKEQLKLSMDYVHEHGGAVIYLQQEGRGIGLANKLAAYELQDHGLDTVDANLRLGFPDDARQYGVLPSILKHMGIASIRLMTNNPRKIERLSALGINIVDTIPILAQPNTHNLKYLQTKQERMDHTNFEHILGNDEDAPVNGIVQVPPPQQQPPHPYNGRMLPLRHTKTPTTGE